MELASPRISPWMALAFCIVLTLPVLIAGTGCGITPNSSTLAAANEDAIRFNISRIQNNVPFGLLRHSKIDGHLYTVNNCSVILYIKSGENPSSSYTKMLRFAGKQISCNIRGENTTKVSQRTFTATVLQFYESSIARPDDVPRHWYGGNRIVLKVLIDEFPLSSPLTVRCGVHFTLFGSPLRVWADITMRAVGCTSTTWGNQCDKTCNCGNSGHCQTFTGNCMCHEGWTGELCQNSPSTIKPKTRMSSSIATTSIETPIVPKLKPTAANSGTNTVVQSTILSPMPNPQNTDVTTRSSLPPRYPMTPPPIIRPPEITTPPKPIMATVLPPWWKNECDITPGTSSLAAAGEDALRFAFTRIQSNAGWVLPDLRNVDHVYTVDGCNLVVYTKSAIVRKYHPLLTNLPIVNVTFSCVGRTENRHVLATGKVVKFLKQSAPRPTAIPKKWYDGERVILEIRYEKFPGATRGTIECSVSKLVSGFTAKIWLDVTMQKAGCLSRRWGTKCQHKCACPFDRQCHTFGGKCANIPPAIETSTIEIAAPSGCSSVKNVLWRQHLAVLCIFTQFTFFTLTIKLYL